ncbi:MAG TPA: hypothetical protein VF179_09690 [Thermoanaerobaculia bacterium]|nr:hypothetical protein [Thermoanaerobaculia bacterium]
MAVSLSYYPRPPKKNLCIVAIPKSRKDVGNSLNYRRVAQNYCRHVVVSACHRKTDNCYIICNHKIELRAAASEVSDLSEIPIEEISNEAVHVPSGVRRKPDQTTKVFKWRRAAGKVFGNNAKVPLLANAITGMSSGRPDL